MTTPITLEVGKRYVLRDGRVTGPLEGTSNADYPLWCNELATSWTRSGAYSIGFDREPQDIVAEYIEPPASPPQPSPEKPPLQWRWMKPDRAGIWALSYGDESDVPKEINVVYRFNASHVYATAWRCHICDLPDISPPSPPSPPKTVTQYLWANASGSENIAEARWFNHGQDVPDYWQPTNITREVEEPQQ